MSGTLRKNAREPRVGATGTGNGGVSDANDTSWSKMKVWQDFDQDGVTDEGELQALESLGISQINLTYDDGTAYSDASYDVCALGNKKFNTNQELAAGIMQ